MLVDTQSLFTDLNKQEIIDNLEHFGSARGPILPENYIESILEFCETTKQPSYLNPHKNCSAIDKIVRNASILDVVKKYLGAQPILWQTELKWSIPNSEKSKEFNSNHSKYDATTFHYDILDYRSLTIFLYLTDVDIHCGPHVVIEGTHKKKNFEELRNITISDSTAHEKFGGRIKSLLGKRGTLFFEEISCYHKAAPCEQKRLMLSVHYVLQRTVPPGKPSSN